MGHWERLETIVVFVYVFFAIFQVHGITAAANGVPALFSFGDSILDTGNNNNLPTLTKCNYPPYGRDFYGGIPTGRFCDGKNPSDLIGNFYLPNSFPFYILVYRISLFYFTNEIH